MNSVNTDPWRNQRKELCNNLHQFARMVIAVFAILPKLIKACASDDECRIDFDAIRSESRVLEELLERLEVSFKAHIW